MATWQLLLIGLVLLFGLCGAVLPGLPGPLMVWAAVLWWSSDEGTSRSWWVLVTATAVLLVSQAVRWLLPAADRRGAGLRRRQLLLAGGTGTLGFLLLPVAGVVPGFLAGIYGWEHVRLGGRRSAVASTRTIMRTIGWNVLVRLSACLLVSCLWVAVVVSG